MKKILPVFLVLFSLFGCGKSNDTQSTAQTTDDIVIVSTNFGDMYIVLYDDTPKHKENFLNLAREGFYDSTTFHRVMSEFMIQGGDPNSKDDIPFNDGRGGPGYTTEAEFNTKYIHKKGAVAAARQADQVNPERRSNGSQFYIVQGAVMEEAQFEQVLANQNNMAKQTLMRDYIQDPANRSVLESLQRNQAAGRMDSVQSILTRIEPLATADFVPFEYTPEQIEAYTTVGGYPFLDNNYTVFGEVIQGLEVIDEIAAQQTDQSDRPLEDIMMKVRVETYDRAEITEKFGYEYN